MQVVVPAVAVFGLVIVFVFVYGFLVFIYWDAITYWKRRHRD